jgi:hypothetical protein
VSKADLFRRYKIFGTMGISTKQFGRLLDNALEALKRYDIGSVKKKLDYETIKAKDLQVLEAYDRAMIGCSLEVANNFEMKRAATGKYEVRLTGDVKVSKTIAVSHLTRVPNCACSAFLARLTPPQPPPLHQKPAACRVRKCAEERAAEFLLRPPKKRAHVAAGKRRRAKGPNLETSDTSESESDTSGSDSDSDNTSANKKIKKRARRESSKAAVYVEDPYETDSLLSEGCENPYDERPVGAPPTDPTGERLLGRTFRLACFLEEAEGS